MTSNVEIEGAEASGRLSREMGQCFGIRTYQTASGQTGFRLDDLDGGLTHSHMVDPARVLAYVRGWLSGDGGEKPATETESATDRDFPAANLVAYLAEGTRNEVRRECRKSMERRLVQIGDDLAMAIDPDDPRVTEEIRCVLRNYGRHLAPRLLAEFLEGGRGDGAFATSHYKGADGVSRWVALRRSALATPDGHWQIEFTLNYTPEDGQILWEPLPEPLHEFSVTGQLFGVIAIERDRHRRYRESLKPPVVPETPPSPAAPDGAPQTAIGD